MRCEIIAVGTELLLGQIVDTNSAWMGEQLAMAGIDSYFHSTVGDNFTRIADTLRHALERSDAVIMCGGLGPTQDDITRDVIAAVMGVDMVRDQAIADRIRTRFEERSRAMPENNLRQADVPVGARTIAQMPGTAPGLVCPIGSCVVYAVPGVPHEMRDMVVGTIIPDLQVRAGRQAVIRSRVLKTWGQSESALAERLAERIEALDASGRATIAFQASGIEGLKVRITAKAASEGEALARIAEEELLVRDVLGDIVFGVDDQSMESVILDALRERGWSLAVAESLTGGLVGSRLTAIPGASDVFRGAVVSYASGIKHALLGVPDGPVISAECARAMAEGARRLLGADVGLATTGVAGPSEQEAQPVGTVFLGLAIGERIEAQEVRLPGDRNRVRQFAVISLLNMLRLELERHDMPDVSGTVSHKPERE